MSVERAWMYDQWLLPPDYGLKDEFMKGVDGFLRFASANAHTPGSIRCPCKNCKNAKFYDVEMVEFHLYSVGFLPRYYRWTCHGELIETQNVRDDIPNQSAHSRVNPNQRNVGFNSFVDMVHDAAGPSFNVPEVEASQDEEPNPIAQAFFDLLKKAKKPIFKGSKDSALSITAKLLSLKTDHNASQSMFNDMMNIWLPNLPEGHGIPKDFYEAKKLVGALGLPHQRIDVCANGCMLFWKDDSILEVCKFCEHPRWKAKSRTSSGRGKKVPFKRLHYLPLIPRLQRLYASDETAMHMTWHAEHTSESGKMCHPSDGEAWKSFDREYPHFSRDSRNIRLGLCIDGFNPFGQSGKNFSSWPVIVTIYNLPPWMCMKKPFMFLTLLEPGPENPKHKIDIYMQPLIDELLQLWGEGAETYDVYRKQNFMMKAALLWTISDFPAYAMLSGWSTAGKLACPYCMDKTDGFWLQNGRKVCFFDCHRKFLPRNHRYRKNKRNFRKDKTINNPPPPRLISDEVWERVKDLPKMVDVGGDTPALPGKGEWHNWIKQSILWELPYWKSNMIRHNLDAMHIIRNVFCNVFYTVMDMKGKTKDNGASREDIKLYCQRPELHIPDNENKKPLARYELDKKRKEVVLKWVKNLKLPDGYCSNLSRCVDLNALTFGGMKSHDCHVFMLRLLPVALREVLPEQVWSTLTELSMFLKDLTSPTLIEETLKRIDEQMPLLLCNLEQIFPPGFFDSMEHLPIHMAYEALVGGPVQYRWMYPFERFLYHLKLKVHNKKHVEGSIINDYLIEETSIFCSYYFKRESQQDDSESDNVRPRKKRSETRYLNEAEYNAAHLFVLLNTQRLEAYQEKFWAEMENQGRVPDDESRNRLLESEYENWFRSYVRNVENGVIDDFDRDIAFRPKRSVTCYDACDVNGFSFHTLEHNMDKSTYNCGVLVKGKHVNDEGCDYYGRLLEVMELSYMGSSKTKFVLFRCEWVDPSSGVRRHHKFNNLVEVNLSNKWRRNNKDPFVFPEQVCQVYYCSTPSVKRTRDVWLAVIPIKAKGHFDINVMSTPYQDDTLGEPHIQVEEDEINNSFADTSTVMVDVDMAVVGLEGDVEEDLICDDYATENEVDDDEIEDEED